jgi:hypothetical protein
MGVVRPTGHLQVKGGVGQRRYFALWRGADERHHWMLGPGHVRNSWRRTLQQPASLRAQPVGVGGE